MGVELNLNPPKMGGEVVMMVEAARCSPSQFEALDAEPRRGGEVNSSGPGDNMQTAAFGNPKAREPELRLMVRYWEFS